METPDSTPSAEAEAETYITGQVMPKASGSDQSEFDTPGTDDDTPQASSGPVWRFLISPQWIAWHLFVVVAFWGMLWLGDWQFHRALSGNGLSWAYTFEWPLFAVFGVVFWARTVRDEFRLRRGGGAASGDETEPSGPVLPEGV